MYNSKRLMNLKILPSFLRNHHHAAFQLSFSADQSTGDVDLVTSSWWSTYIYFPVTGHILTILRAIASRKSKSNDGVDE
ncbi:hypothetical protein KC326_g142 [Hortaea werneckii]|nr:hypothetical protein KC326_g142 [Hortaea werneckii]